MTETNAIKKGDRVRLLDRITGLEVDHPTDGTVLQVYPGMRTGTLYAVVKWDHTSYEHVLLPDQLVKIDA